MGTDMTFVEKAREEALTSPIYPGEQRANALLAGARESIYHWPADFQGFSATLTLISDQERWQTNLKAQSSQAFSYDFDEPLERPLRNWLNYQLGELLAHREAPERSRMASRSGVEEGDYDQLFGTQIIFPEDPMGSYYRIRDHRITQIYRHYPKSRFLINIDSHHNFRGKFAAHCYSAYYWSRETDLFQKTETYIDEYAAVGSVFLPRSRRYSVASNAGLSNRQILLSDHRLLGENEVVVTSSAAPKCPFHS